MAEPARTISVEWGSLERRVRSALIGHGSELTPLRLRVLRALFDAHQPVGAYDLSERVGGEVGGRRIAANSIYRILLLFTELGVVRRVESRNAYVVARDGDAGSDVFFLCDGCGAVTAIDQPQLAALLTIQASALGFHPHHQVVEVAGQCRSCAKTLTKDQS